MIQRLIKYKNYLLFGVMILALICTAQISGSRRQTDAQTVSIPLVYEAAAQTLDKAERYRRERDAKELQDMAALQAMIDNASLDEQTRSDAAARLKLLVDQREKQTALEGALLESSLWPCVAVVTPGSVTLVTEKTTLTSRDNAMLIELALAHTGVEKNGIRVICAEKK